MNVRALRIFVAVAEERHFGRAAERLRLAQPAVSQTLKRLEEDVGAPLLIRTTRSVELTDIGRHLLARARSILGEVDRTEAELADLRAGRAGRVALGFVGTATYDVLPRVCRRLRDDRPGIELEIHGEQLTPALLEMLLDRRLDLALVRDPEPSAHLDVVPLRTERLIAALPADDAPPGESVALTDLRSRPFVVHPSGYRSAMFAAVLRACRQAGFAPQDLIEVSETSTLVAFVAAGLGVALVPEPVRSLAVPGVAYRNLNDVEVDTELTLVTRSGEASALLDDVRDIVVREVAHSSASTS